MNDNVTLRVNGREWNGWTSVRIGAGIERLARDLCGDHPPVAGR